VLKKINNMKSKTRGPGKIREDKSQRGALATLMRAWYVSLRIILHEIVCTGVEWYPFHLFFLAIGICATLCMAISCNGQQYFFIIMKSIHML
jgi:hypothetical protein